MSKLRLDYEAVPCPDCDAPTGQACHAPIEEQCICSGGNIGTTCLGRVRCYMLEGLGRDIARERDKQFMQAILGKGIG